MRDLPFRRALALASLLALIPALAGADASEPRATSPSTEHSSAPALPPAKAYGEFSQERIEHGRYLTLAGNCLGCHRRPGGKAFAGGLALDTPFGVIYSPNITPHKDWGIGSFSDEDFLRALRHGIRPDGTPYYPTLPYRAFAKVKDDDLLAIKDYLFSLEPSDYRPPATQLRWPFDQRDPLFGWQALYLRDQRIEPNPAKSAEWNRGAYLVEGLGHCDSCHTPRDPADATATWQTLTNILIDGWYAPTLADPLGERLRVRNLDALAAYLRTQAPPAATSPDRPVGSPVGSPATGQAGSKASTQPMGAAAPGPMPGATHPSLSRLADSDVRAIAVYLMDRPAQEVPRQQPELARHRAPRDSSEGQRLYRHYCAGCHQSHGQGLAPYFPALRGNERVTLPRPDAVVLTLLLGAPADPAKAFSAHVVMPSFGSLLDDRQISVLASYIRANWGNDAPPVTAGQVSHLRHGD